eukprot:3288563-Pyramimonas_sp.AAC.1
MQEAQVYSHHGPTPEKVVFVRAPFDFKRDVSVHTVIYTPRTCPKLKGSAPPLTCSQAYRPL